MKRLERQRRRQEVLNSADSHTDQEWKALKRVHNFMCLCCKRYEPEIKLTRDHITPISRGGNNRIENIQPLCTSCNNSKFTKNTSYIASSSLSWTNVVGEVNNL
jgi:5-methylcytosine-specific restriction endonuclease McrA